MIHLILFVILIILSFLAVELDNLTYSIISLAGFGLVLGMIFFILGAVYVSVLQILIFGGTITILFFILINLTEEKGEQRIFAPRIKGLEIPGVILLMILILTLLGLMTFLPVEKMYTPLSEVSEELSTWIWNYRLTDTISQAFILFSALVGILTIWWRK